MKKPAPRAKMMPPPPMPPMGKIKGDSSTPKHEKAEGPKMRATEKKKGKS